VPVRANAPRVHVGARDHDKAIVGDDDVIGAYAKSAAGAHKVGGLLCAAKPNVARI
jgi:hypothetical protein